MTFRELPTTPRGWTAWRCITRRPGPVRSRCSSTGSRRRGSAGGTRPRRDGVGGRRVVPVQVW